MDLSFNFDNARFAFGNHDRVTIEGTAYKVELVTEDGVVFGTADGRGLCQQFTHGQLSRLASMGRLRQERDYFLATSARSRLKSNVGLVSDLTGRKAAVHSKRSAYVEAFYQLEREKKIKRTDESIRANMDLLKIGAIDVIGNLNRSGSDKPGLMQDMRKAPSPRTLRTWLAANEATGAIGLVDRVHQRGHRGRRMGPEEIGILQRELRAYLSPDRPTVKQIHENVLIAFEKRNAERAEKGLAALDAPSRETVRRSIRRLDPFVVLAAREGADVARKKFRPVMNGLELTRPLERIEIDEWTVDLMTLFETVGLAELMNKEELIAAGLTKAKGRWKLSIAICATTRVIVGMALSRSANADTALQTLQMILVNKGKWADGVGALTAWDMFGTPELIVTDCGSAYRSEQFRNACGDLGITLLHATAGVPESRGRGERIFETVGDGLMSRLSGRTFSDVVTKGDADPEERAALTLEDLAFALVRWVVDIYHNTTHSGLGGETPLECWRRLTKEYGVIAPPDIAQQRAVFGQRLSRSLNKEGVTVLGVRYHSRKLAEWMLRRDSCKVEVRWHPKDIGAVQVLLGKDWHTVPSVADGLDGVSAQVWLAANREAQVRKPDAKKRNLPTILAAVQAIRERNAAAMQAADLLVETWDDARIEREERRLFAQVKFAGEEPQKSGDGGLGRTIEAVHPDHDANDAAPKPAAVRAAKGDPAGKRPAGSKTTPTSRPAKSGGGFSIEEN